MTKKLIFYQKGIQNSLLRNDEYTVYAILQSLRKVLEHLQYFLDCLINIPLSPQNNVGLWKIYTQYTRQFTCR